MTVETESRTESTFKPISLLGLRGIEWIRAARLNSLGSLYWFTKVTLKKRRLNKDYHHRFCLSLEREHIKDVREEPRDHFKSTIGAEALPMWRVLYCSDEDLDGFRRLGYSEEFLQYMRRVHRPEARNLLVSENITNAGKLGRRIDFHYQSNALFRTWFPELIPTTQETWSNITKWQRLPAGLKAEGGHGEGTFDFLGVGGALQSRHYNGIVVQDDLVGKKAYESQVVMDKTIEYHRLMVGAFENESAIDENDELVIGNRWAYTDLNSWVRENEPWFRIETHSALGGCCSSHPPDLPIFPEEFSSEKLERWRKRLGNYLFSCQFLNNPAAPENADFHESDLRYYSITEGRNDEKTIVHEVTNGVVIEDVKVNQLVKCLVTDPNHSGAQGRARHSINVVGLSAKGRYYLLDCWAQAVNTDTYLAKLYEFADKWSIKKLGVETVAAQKYLAYHIKFRNQLENRYLRIIELKGEVDAPDGGITRNKEFRIRNVLSPIFESNRFFIQRRFMDFKGEFTTFPRGLYCDILDGLAYAPQMLKLPQSYIDEQKARLANAQGARKINQPYSVRIN